MPAGGLGEDDSDASSMSGCIGPVADGSEGFVEREHERSEHSSKKKTDRLRKPLRKRVYRLT